jgi:hypothetical protein
VAFRRSVPVVLYRWECGNGCRRARLCHGIGDFLDELAALLLDQLPLATILEREDVRKQVLQWVGTIYYFYGESREAGPPPNEAEFYGAAFLLVKKWTESCSSADIVGRIRESRDRVAWRAPSSWRPLGSSGNRTRKRRS